MKNVKDYVEKISRIYLTFALYFNPSDFDKYDSMTSIQLVHFGLFSQFLG